MKRIYLDHNATTPTNPDVISLTSDVMSVGPLNPASQHSSGRTARRLLESAREDLSTALNLRLSPPSQEDRLIFTSGGTESNNMLLQGIVSSGIARLILSAVEHPSLTRAGEALRDQGVSIADCRVQRNGEIDLNHLDELTRTPAAMACLMLANNETGVIQPIAEAIKICSERGIPVHSDAAQVAGKLPIDFQALNVGSITLAAHKFHGPVGIGALAIRNDLAIRPLMFGGFQQLGRRPGTESVALAVGMAKALELSLQHQPSEQQRLGKIRDEFEQRLISEVPGIEIHGRRAKRLEHVSCIGFPGVEGQELFVALDMIGIDCSTGSACASGSAEVSPILLAMGVPQALAASSLRFSFGSLNEAADGQIAAERIINHFKYLHR